MKEQIKKIILKIKSQNTRTIVISISIFLIVIVSAVYYFTKNTNTEAEIVKDSSEVVNLEEEIVSIVGANVFLTDKNAINNSWPAEIISNNISQIQPQREGSIIDWRVHVGERVRQGQILGRISAPPATPELIKMLAEQTEAFTRAKAEAGVTNEYIKNEQTRLDALTDSVNGKTDVVSTTTSLVGLDGMRKKVETKKIALRFFIEQKLSDHLIVLLNIDPTNYYINWRNYSFSKSSMKLEYGLRDTITRNQYESALFALDRKLRDSTDIPIESAKNYFSAMIQLINNSIPSDLIMKLQKTVVSDQNEFFALLADYQEAQAEVLDKETEYKLMISEKSSMLHRDRSMALSDVTAMEASYNTVYNEIKGEGYIRAPRSGTISAIYKKVGDLVGPEMAIAVIAGGDNSSLIARIRIPNNIIKPKVGEILTAVRPGFPKDTKEVKIMGIGSSLDDTGSYMADAVFMSNIDWPIGSSIRVIASATSTSPVIKYSSIIWGEGGKPSVWAVSSAGRIYQKQVKIGRILGTQVEIYEGLKNGDKYISSPTADIKEDMLLEEIIGTSVLENSVENPAKKEKSGGHSDDGNGH